MIYPLVLTRSKSICFKNPLNITKGICDACGHQSIFDIKPIITDALANDWQLSSKERKEFDIRESRACAHCSNSLRTRVMAGVLVGLYAENAKNLSELTKEVPFNSLRIAEINSCGNLHQFFTNNQNIIYSEFGSINKNIPNEDLQELTYENESFDVVLTSETLEHVPDLNKSIEEINRILTPGGRHIFTIPVILNRSTRDRIAVENGGSIQILPPSYHGEEKIGFLVAREIGGDIIELIESKGFKVDLYGTYLLRDTHSYVFVCTKERNR